MSYRASNPARVAVKPWIWLKNGGKTTQFLTVALVVSIVLLAAVQPQSQAMATRLRLLPLVLALLNVINWFNVFQKAKMGDLNPGVVVQSEPMLVAVLAAMAKDGTAPWYALRISKWTLKGADGQPLPVGTPLAAACIYDDKKADNAKGRWADFGPDPVPAYTDDKRALDRTVDAIPEESWALLEDALLVIPDRKPGLRFLRLTDTGLTASA